MDTQTHLEIHKILVVDDDVRLRTLLQFLEEQGYSVKACPMLYKWTECCA